MKNKSHCANCVQLKGDAKRKKEYVRYKGWAYCITWWSIHNLESLKALAQSCQWLLVMYDLGNKRNWPPYQLPSHFEFPQHTHRWLPQLHKTNYDPNGILLNAPGSLSYWPLVFLSMKPQEEPVCHDQQLLHRLAIPISGVLKFITVVHYLST